MIKKKVWLHSWRRENRCSKESKKEISKNSVSYRAKLGYCTCESITIAKHEYGMDLFCKSQIRSKSLTNICKNKRIAREYGRYEALEKPIGSQHKIIFYWDKIEKNRGAFLNKIYGFKSGEKRYTGLLEKINGGKIGKSSIILPIEHKEEIIGLLKKYGVRAKAIEIFTIE